jgi:hypothetical protein
LVRQRSWVQIPAKAYLFCQKESEMGSNDTRQSLLKTVSSLPNSVSLQQAFSNLWVYQKRDSGVSANCSPKEDSLVIS